MLKKNTLSYCFSAEPEPSTLENVAATAGTVARDVATGLVKKQNDDDAVIAWQ
jgi:hypothetical protein